MAQKQTVVDKRVKRWRHLVRWRECLDLTLQNSILRIPFCAEVQSVSATASVCNGQCTRQRQARADDDVVYKYCNAGAGNACADGL